MDVDELAGRTARPQRRCQVIRTVPSDERTLVHGLGSPCAMHSHLADANGSLQRAHSRPALPRSRRFVPQRSFDRDRGASCAKDNVFGGLDALLGWCILGGLTLVAPRLAGA